MPIESESGHWYYPNGTPAYTVIGKNGKERPTTLRDARKDGLVPSVTTILQCVARPGLERWKSEQLLLAGLTLKRQDGESEKDWIARVWEDSKEQTRKAAERGTAIHAAIEKYYRGAPYDFQDHVHAALREIAAYFPNEKWKPERCFAHPMGYGGKVDLHSENVLLDIKTKDGNLSNVKLYDEHFMQTAAYAHGLGIENPQCAVLFVSRTEPKAQIALLEPQQVERGWRMFTALLDYWMVTHFNSERIACSTIEGSEL